MSTGTATPRTTRQAVPRASAPPMIGWYDAMLFAAPRHRHRSLQLSLAMHGRATILVGDRAYRQQPRCALWVFPDEEHAIVEQTPDFAMWFVYFPMPLVRRACTSESSRALLSREAAGDAARILDATAARTLDAFLRSAYEIRDRVRFNAALAYLLLSAWELFAGVPAVAAADDVHPAVERAAQLLSSEVDETSLDVMARRVGLSASRLSHLFHEQMGASIPEYRNRQRIDRFLRIYADGRRFSLTEAALEASFGSYSQFQRVFEKVMRMTPAEYRRKVVGRTTI